MCKPVKCPQCGHEFTPERAIKDVFNSIFKEPKNFYTKEEFDKIKKEKTAI